MPGMKKVAGPQGFPHEHSPFALLLATSFLPVEIPVIPFPPVPSRWQSPKQKKQKKQTKKNQKASLNVFLLKKKQ